jgi:hypothetical protein
VRRGVMIVEECEIFVVRGIKSYARKDIKEVQ